MKIKSIKHIGCIQTFSPEMETLHNYLTENSNAIHKNSHTAAYTMLSYRCLWFKAHFLEEWWASVLSDPPDRDKLVRWMGTAKIEGAHFGILDVNKLTIDFTVHKGKILPGISMIKGIGAATAKNIKVNPNKPIRNLTDFINLFGSGKTVLERLIKLGAFDDLHKSRKALWAWWQYKYGKDIDSRNLKKQIKWSLAWPKKSIEEVRNVRIAAYFKEFPNRKKVPPKLANWVPTNLDPNGDKKYGTILKEGFPTDRFDPQYKLCAKIEPNLEDIERLFHKDFTLLEILRFEKKYLGFFWHSPMGVYDVKGHTIAKAKEDGLIECVIEKIEQKQGPKTSYVQLQVTDGIEAAKIMVWQSELIEVDESTLKENVGIRTKVNWNDKYRSFNIARNAPILPLKAKKCN